MLLLEKNLVKTMCVMSMFSTTAHVMHRSELFKRSYRELGMIESDGTK